MQNERLNELREKETLTDAEMRELIKLSPGEFRKSPVNLAQMGVRNIERAFDNLKEGAERSKHALDSGCYIEVISLRLQHVEFWLRMFWVAKNGRGKIFGPRDKRTFGKIVKDCANLGFCRDLISRLEEFNEHRIDALHKYLLGAISYEDLRDVCDAYYGLDGEVAEYVRREVGIPFTND